jgi:hypothetical protein
MSGGYNKGTRINMKKITKLSDLNQIDGQLHPELEDSKEIRSQSSKITRLDQLLNSDIGFNKYKTMDADVYKNELDSMNLVELRSHANRVAGIVPSATRERVIKQLLLAFRKHVAAFNVPDHSDSNVLLSRKKVEIGLDILKAVK